MGHCTGRKDRRPYLLHFKYFIEKKLAYSWGTWIERLTIPRNLLTTNHETYPLVSFNNFYRQTIPLCIYPSCFFSPFYYCPCVLYACLKYLLFLISLFFELFIRVSRFYFPTPNTDGNSLVIHLLKNELDQRDSVNIHANFTIAHARYSTSVCSGE